MSSEPRAYQFSYNESGAIPTSALSNPTWLLLSLCALAFPVIPYLHYRVGISPLYSQYLPNFWVLQRARYISDSDLVSMEISTVIWFLIKSAHFASIYTFARDSFRFTLKQILPQPILIRLDRSPATQFSRFLVFGGGLMLASFTLSPILFFMGALEPKYAFLILATYGGGWLFLPKGSQATERLYWI